MIRLNPGRFIVQALMKDTGKYMSLHEMGASISLQAKTVCRALTKLDFKGFITKRVVNWTGILHIPVSKEIEITWLTFPQHFIKPPRER